MTVPSPQVHWPASTAWPVSSSTLGGWIHLQETRIRLAVSLPSWKRETFMRPRLSLKILLGRVGDISIRGSAVPRLLGHLQGTTHPVSYQ